MHRASVLLHRRSIQSVSAALPAKAQVVRHLSSAAAKGKAAAGRTRRAKGANAAGVAAGDPASSGDRAAAAGKGVGAAASSVASNPVKLSALMLAIKRIEQTHGKGSLMRFGDRGAELPKVDVIPTGSMTLDDALGVGGLPRGRVVEIYGPESSGKTTVALHVIAQAQRQGGTCVFIDAEHALDPAYAKRIGVNVNDLYISQPDNGEQALDIADTLIKSGTVDCVVVDSVAALVPKAELEGDMGDHHIALQARLMSQALRKLTATISRTNCLLIFINQIRQKVGVIFGSNEVTTGGTALRFYSSVRLEIRKGQQIRTEGETLGTRIKVKVVKNKLAPPFGQAEFDMLFGTGIDTRGEVLDLALDLGLAVKSGSWFSLADLPEQYRHLSDSWPILMGQGRDKVKVYLEQHPQIFEALADAVREELRKAEIDRWSSTSSDNLNDAGEEESSGALEVTEDLDDAQKLDVASVEIHMAAAADGSQAAEGMEDVSAIRTLAAGSGETAGNAEFASEPVAPRRRSRRKGQSKGEVASAAGASSSVDSPAGATPLEFVAATGPVDEPMLGGGVDLGIDYVTGEATNLDAYVAKA